MQDHEGAHVIAVRGAGQRIAWTTEGNLWRRRSLSTTRQRRENSLAGRSDQTPPCQRAASRKIRDTCGSCPYPPRPVLVCACRPLLTPYSAPVPIRDGIPGPLSRRGGRFQRPPARTPASGKGKNRCCCDGGREDVATHESTPVAPPQQNYREI
jgi:hypothetical protein